MAANRTYIAIDLKSFYASVECVERGLNPLTTNLVVADKSRTEKTICLAVSPPLKAHGISGRARLFEVVQRVKEVNALRRRQAPGYKFTGKSAQAEELRESPELELDYIVAPPRMAYYLEYSTKIYQIYLKYVAPEDIHVYSIDEVFMDVTHYLKTYQKTPRQLAQQMGSQQRRGLERICICARSQWIFWQNISFRMRMGCGSPVWMRSRIVSCCGRISRSRIFGASAPVMRRNWLRKACIRWEILRGVH